MSGLNILDIIRKCVNLSEEQFVFENRNITLKIKDLTLLETVKSDLNSSNINYSIYGIELIIDIANTYFNTKIFTSFDDFRNRFNLSDIDNNIAIIDLDGKGFFYDKDSNQSYIDNVPEDIFIFENAVSYLNLLRSLRSEAFADYYNSQNQEVVLYSSERGIKKIKTYNQIVKFDYNHNTSMLISRLLSQLENIDYQNQFKIQLYFLDRLPNANISDVYTLWSNIEQICDVTNNNYLIWAKRFSFDSLLTDFRKQKEKYFNSLRGILSRILSQATSVPIAISASVFATYKIDEPIILGIVFVAFTGYILFTIRILISYYNDIHEVKSDFKQDLEIINKESGLNHNDIKSQERLILKKIKFTQNTIVGLSSLFVILSAAFTFFVLYMLMINFQTKIILSVIYLFIVLMYFVLQMKFIR